MRVMVTVAAFVQLSAQSSVVTGGVVSTSGMETSFDHADHAEVFPALSVQ